MILLVKILLLITIMTLITGCPRVRTNTKRHPMPNVILTDETKLKWITVIGYNFQKQEQQILTKTGIISKEDSDNDHFIFGGWRKVTPDLAIGISTTVTSWAALAQYRIFKSSYLDWNAGISTLGNFGAQTSFAFKNIHDKFVPFASFQYRQLQRRFNSYDLETTRTEVNEVHVREEVLDYQIGIQMKNRLGPKNSSGSGRVQIFIGHSEVSKIKLLSETTPSAYRDDLGLTYGSSLIAEF